MTALPIPSSGERTTLIARRRRGHAGPQRGAPVVAVLRAGLSRRGCRAGRRPDRAAAHLLPETGSGLEPAPGHGLSRHLQFSLDHQAGLWRFSDFVPLFGYRRKTYLVAANGSPSPPSCGRRSSPRRAISSGRCSSPPTPWRYRARCAAPCWSRTASGSVKWAVREPAMAVVQRRRHGRGDRGGPARALFVAGWRAARRRGDRGGRPVGGTCSARCF